MRSDRRRPRTSETADHPFHVLRRLRAGRGWIRGQPSGDSSATRTTPPSTRCWAGPPASSRSTRSSPPTTPPAPGSRRCATRTRRSSWRPSTPRRDASGRPSSSSASRPTASRTGASLIDADDPDRALEEERRLAYVALTRATRQLILAFDPARPSPFLAEMGLAPAHARLQPAGDRLATAATCRRRLGVASSGHARARGADSGRCTTAAHRRDLLRRAGRDELAALVAALRPEVDHPVGRLDDVEVVLDDDDRVAALDQA